jgi:hypothetical protein
LAPVTRTVAFSIFMGDSLGSSGGERVELI